MAMENISSSLESRFFRSFSSTLTLTIEDNDIMGMVCKENEIYRDAQAYLSTKINSDAVNLRISKCHQDKHVSLYPSYGEIVNDVYQDVEIKWRIVRGSGGEEKRGCTEDDGRNEYFQLSFDKKHKDLILNSYFPHIASKAKEIRSDGGLLMLYFLNNSLRWESIIFEHPSTFGTMAMEDNYKRSVIADLDLFSRRKEFYKRVGKIWKRCYLLYGPGTEKFSLIAAIAKHLKFDVYELQVANVTRDSDLRRLLLAIRSRSILVLENIDCTVDLPNKLEQDVESKNHGQSQGPLSLSRLLSILQGLWSSCGDEQILIVKTTPKDNLRTTLQRSGLIDGSIYMGYCSFQEFKTIALNYLGLNDTTNPHRLYPEIKRLLNIAEMTPAQVASEVMKSEDADIALECLVRVLKDRIRESKP